jgi:predicted metal-dependent phosphoesterase TrpH
MRQLISLSYLFIFFLIAGLSPINEIVAQTIHSLRHERAIKFPDIPGYKTLVCDFHQHTVFSDGEVWPSIRVKEALKDGLDAISITDHLEYQPNKLDIPHADRNRSYQLALKEANLQDIIIINGAEITREMPPGHINAIFLNDANQLLQDDVLSVCREAKKQDAFIFWNHPNWAPQCQDGMAKLTDLHRQLIDEELIDGIEVVNGDIYSEKALQIALDNNLTIMGNSDIHSFIDWDYDIAEGGHRPVTLIFAKEKSKFAIKKGLKNRRTVVWFNNTLIGNSKYLIPLIQESLLLKKAEVLESYKGKSFVHSLYIKNQSDVDYILENQSKFSFYSHANIITIKAHNTTLIQVKTLETLSTYNLRFKVLNAYVAPNKHPEIVLKIEVKEN